MTTLRILIALIGVAYLIAAWKQHRHGTRWPVSRTALFIGGIVTLEFGLSPQLMQYAHGDVRMHMFQHLLIGMYAPLALVFARPMTLLLKTLRPAQSRRVVAFLGNRLVRLWCHPITSAVFNVGGMALLYLTGLYALQLHTPSLSLVVHVHFIVAGCLFTWAVAGPDPAPHRPSLSTRLAVLVIAMACHAVLGKWMYFVEAPVITGATSMQIQHAAQWMFYGGELAEAILVFVLARQWLQRHEDAHLPINKQRLTT
ncbi:cytochrome c oxidase assembly protein [Larsenimonas salina]|uniref:cytochrome c oxidase assembly protein n=1 Tax=Larsenimonas salina TaxID=1295565 RepID=UPI0020745C6E|nr:cytochrome c oxidase assembly protein [Larsenimonas salina]MCM5704859.1 cytochrome c oxidase assembly protein [Larsenimonas salina]